MPILRGERAACLGMSEPERRFRSGQPVDAGGARRRPVRDQRAEGVDLGREPYADFCFLFCRTDPEAPKHKGISIILVEMDTPGGSPCGPCRRSCGPSTPTSTRCSSAT